jgi:hypothetical protein
MSSTKMDYSKVVPLVLSIFVGSIVISFIFGSISILISMIGGKISVMVTTIGISIVANMMALILPLVTTTQLT